ncbi:hypothetical protein ACO0LL_30240 [Undibacterium sp. TC4M20W]|uniref:hypothetical protein n=1 Tax=Undibacterium sp. TC4M20W TaxID=3413052 RepID=UPI003BF16F2E
MEMNLDQMLIWINRVEEQELDSIQHIFDIDEGLRSRGAYNRAADNPSHQIEGLIMLSQARWVLQNDLEMANKLLGKITGLAALSSRAIQEIDHARSNNYAWDYILLSYSTFVPILVGLLLAGAEKEFFGLSEKIVSCSSFDHESRGHIVGEFAFQISNLAVGKYGLDSLSAIESTKGFKKSHFIYGYHELLYHIAHNDPEAFERVRGELESAFPKRVRSRIALGQLETWGYGKVAQSATFDALGTALCRLALWRGMAIDVNTKLYPKEFYAA